MLTAIYHMLKDGTQHQDLGADHFDRHDGYNKLVDEKCRNMVWATRA
jgi:hypothetical protein